MAPLRLSRPVSAGARRHSRDNVRRRWFSHAAPGGRVWSSGYAQPPHRHAILTPSYRDAGTGVALGGPATGGGSRRTVDFGGKRWLRAVYAASGSSSSPTGSVSIPRSAAYANG
jgi:uncharacterized protein YkwD